MTRAMLEIDIRCRMGEAHLAVRLASEGPVTAVFGRSGAGKTTLINLIAGLLRPDSGRIALGGEALVDIEAGLWRPSHTRQIGYIFQEARLFPHLNVRHNLTFGRWFRHLPADARKMDRIIGLLGLETLLARRPETLSGGERQRVAIGRALLSEPRLLLMDEPLSSLDGSRKAEILRYIEAIRDETSVPIVYVSHDVGEVERLANRVAVLEGGALVAFGAAQDIVPRLKGGDIAQEVTHAG